MRRKWCAPGMDVPLGFMAFGLWVNVVRLNKNDFSR